ncbi:MAG: 50S ribosomal protein L4 [Candidatus Izimaplasma sp.]|nr:50S ribosomal protein L4 [Candidatus Izimaplasma bacterium]
MPKLTKLNQTGNSVGEVELSDSVFGIKPNQQAVFDVVKATLAGKRQGTHNAKSRGYVRGGGRKPHQQKGSGRARAGTIRSPLWNGGGVVFGPTPRDYSLKVNRKVKRLALRSVLSQKVLDNTLTVLDDITLDRIKTKDVVEMLTNLEISGKTIILTDLKQENLVLSARNIPDVTVNTTGHASAYDLMYFTNVVLTEAAVKQYEEVLG